MESNAALAAHNRAYSQAFRPFDLATAARNIAVTSWKIANQNKTKLHNAKCQQLAIYHWREAVIHFDRAFGHSSAVRGEAWIDSLKTSFHECLQDVKDFVAQQSDYDKRISLLETFKAQIHNCVECKANICIELATQIFRWGVTVLSEGNYKRAIYCMNECYQPLEEARQWAGGQKDILSEVNVLKADVFMTLCTAESIKCKLIGDKLLEETLKNQEELNMTAIFEVLDWYKQSILLTRETEIEMEAIGHSRLGKVYAEVLKVQYKANEYFVRCIQLAHSLHPRTFHGVDWFQTATQFVETYQKERLQQETDKWQEERKKYLEELKDELKTLEAREQARKKSVLPRHKADTIFIKFIYETHPPKGGQTLPGEDDLKAMGHFDVKDLFKKSVIHYHPDRNKKYGKTWQTLCEEITKCLTAVYESYK